MRREKAELEAVEKRKWKEGKKKGESVIFIGYYYYETFKKKRKKKRERSRKHEAYP